MKRIDIDLETEKMIAQLLDMLLKGCGFQAYPAVQNFLSKVYEVPEVVKEE